MICRRNSDVFGYKRLSEMKRSWQSLLHTDFFSKNKHLKEQMWQSYLSPNSFLTCRMTGGRGGEKCFCLLKKKQPRKGYTGEGSGLLTMELSPTIIQLLGKMSEVHITGEIVLCCGSHMKPSSNDLKCVYPHQNPEFTPTHKTFTLGSSSRFRGRIQEAKTGNSRTKNRRTERG